MYSHFDFDIKSEIYLPNYTTQQPPDTDRRLLLSPVIHRLLIQPMNADNVLQLDTKSKTPQYLT